MLSDHLFKKRGTRQRIVRLPVQSLSVKRLPVLKSKRLQSALIRKKLSTKVGTLNSHLRAGLRVVRRCGLIASMAILKKRDHQTESRLLLESGEPVDLPPAEVSLDAVLVQFEKLRPYIPELIDALRAGAFAEPVAVMNDGSTFAIHGETRTFWVKLWHTAGSELTKVERVQVISCLPSTRGTNVIIGDEPQD